jgi:hypothetical protein
MFILIWFWGWKSNKRWWKVLCMQIIHPKRNQREPMINIHEMATMWPIQTLGSFGLLNWKTCDQEKRCIFMTLLQEWLVLKSCYLY